MSMQYPGGIVSKTPPTVSTTSASGVWTLSQQSSYQKQSAWPLAADPYFNYVTMLLHGDGTNNGQNNTFRDSSSNNFTITRNGNTTQGSFSPYGTLWSNYFDGAGGTGDYLSVPDNASLEGFADFTIEGWVYVTDFSSGDVIAAKGWTPGGYTPWMLYFSATDLTFYASSTLSSWNIASGDVIIPNIQKNTWYHFAVSRSGSSLRLFSNGSLTTTVSTSTTIGTNAGALTIGASLNGDRDPAMYLSNFRINTTALYTAAFTPSTTPLTAVSGTSLLTCQSNRFIDNSSNAFAITVNGNTSVQRFSPFAPSSAYDTTTNGGSGYFDGTGDFLAASSATNLNLGSGDFTVECWVYVFQNPGAPKSFMSQSDVNSNGWALGLNGTAGQLWWYSNSTAVINTSSSIQINAWNHVAAVRSGSTVTVYINGASAGSATNTTNYSGGSSFYIGSDQFSQSLNGYISGVRIVKGTAVYTGAFTPPTSAPTAITNTQLLCNMTNGAIFDTAMINDFETISNAKISTSVVKYGTGSLAFDGNGDWLINYNSARTSPPYQKFGLKFTIEFWIYRTSTNANQWIISTGQGYNDSTYNGFLIGYYTSYGGGSLAIAGYGLGAYWFGGNTSIGTNQWIHCAVVGNGTSCVLYLNGTNVGSQTWPVGYTGFDAYGWIVGDGAQSTSLRPPLNPFGGNIDELRITNGVARYTANFTPPGSAFPNQ